MGACLKKERKSHSEYSNQHNIDQKSQLDKNSFTGTTTTSTEDIRKVYKFKSKTIGIFFF